MANRAKFKVEWRSWFDWSRSMSMPGIYKSKESAQAAIRRRGSHGVRYRVRPLKEREKGTTK